MPGVAGIEYCPSVLLAARKTRFRKDFSGTTTALNHWLCTSDRKHAGL
jgi:hypothetical protein